MLYVVHNILAAEFYTQCFELFSIEMAREHLAPGVVVATPVQFTLHFDIFHDIPC